MKNISRNIRNYRMLKGYSQENLAKHLRKSQNWISLLENGKIKTIDTSTLHSICEYLKIGESEMTVFQSFGQSEPRIVISILESKISEIEITLKEIRTQLQKLHFLFNSDDDDPLFTKKSNK